MTAVADIRLELSVNEDRLVDQLVTLERREATELANLGRIALDMGDALLKCRDDFETLQRLSERTGIPVATLRERRQVAGRLPADVREHPGFLVVARYAVYQTITRVADEAERARLFELIHNQAPPASRSGRWRRDDILRLIGHRPYQQTPDERVAAIVSNPELAAQAFRQIAQTQPDIVENTLRDDLATSSVVATAQYNLQQEAEKDYQRGIEDARVGMRDTALTSPALTNDIFLGNANRMIRNWALQLGGLAENLASPELQGADMGARWSLRQALLDLQRRTQTCIDKLPQAWDAVDSDGVILVATSRESIQLKE